MGDQPSERRTFRPAEQVLVDAIVVGSEHHTGSYVVHIAAAGQVRVPASQIHAGARDVTQGERAQLANGLEALREQADTMLRHLRGPVEVVG